MTEFALAPASKWDATSSAYRSPRVMLEQGELMAYRVRGNGTMRHVSLYPVHSTDREVAEFISDRVDMDGASVQAVARELHVSTATVRRYLEGLELTEEIEAGEWDGLTFGTDGQPVFDTTFSEEDYAGEISPEAPGAQCEPIGTTAEELPEALAKSLAATVAAGNARQARTTRTVGPEIHMCICDEQGNEPHELGIEGCAHQGQPATTRNTDTVPVRRPRSH
jgi:hypothetical protein